MPRIRKISHEYSYIRVEEHIQTEKSRQKVTMQKSRGKGSQIKGHVCRQFFTYFRSSVYRHTQICETSGLGDSAPCISEIYPTKR